MPTLFLTKSDVSSLLDMASVITAVEQAFKALGRGEARMPAKAYLAFEQGDFRAMPAALPGAVGIKWANVHPQNPARGLPTVMAVLIYNDPETGYPLAIIDATELTAYRTGATAAIASKYLARQDSHTLGMVGAGRQAYTQLIAHAELFDIKLVKVFDISRAAVEKFIRHFPRYTIRESSLEETAASDIVCTLTPARAPVLRKEWIKPGTHINAVGADAEGKEELEPSTLKGARVVVDDMRQAVAGGEVNVPIKLGLYRADEIYGTLAEIVAGKKQGRKKSEEVTIFDSTGIAIEDIAAAGLVYSKARQSGGYLWLDFVDG